MDVLKQVVADSVLDKIKSGEWSVGSISEKDGGLVIAIQTETKERAVAAVVEQPTSVDEVAPKHKLHRSPEAREHLRTLVYSVMSFDIPMQCKEIAAHPDITVGPSAVLRALREMPGSVEEVSGHKTKNFKFIRKPIPGDLG